MLHLVNEKLNQMKIDIEKLNRKMPYPEPSDEFFKTLQDNVISKTIGQNPVVEKNETRVFSLNFKWMAAAGVVLIGGITAFLGFDNSSETQTFTHQKPIVDSVYNLDEAKKSSSSEQLAYNNVLENSHQGIIKPKTNSPHHIASAKMTVSDIKSNNSARQDYNVENSRKSDSEVEKVLVAFTPEQLKDLDKNSEQDVYLDLYN